MLCYVTLCYVTIVRTKAPFVCGKLAPDRRDLLLQSLSAATMKARSPSVSFDDVKQGSAGMTLRVGRVPMKLHYSQKSWVARDKVTSQELNYAVCKKQNLTNMTCVLLRWLDPVYIHVKAYLPSLELLHT